MNLKNILDLSGEQGSPLLLGHAKAHWDWAAISQIVTPLSSFPTTSLQVLHLSMPVFFSLLPLSLH